MGCYIGVPMIVFGIYLTKHPQPGDRFQIQIRNTDRGDGPLKVFGIYLERRRNSGVLVFQIQIRILFVEEIYLCDVDVVMFEGFIRYIFDETPQRWCSFVQI